MAGPRTVGIADPRLRRYILFQVPGWVLAAVLLVWLWPRTGLSVWAGLAVYGLWAVKDLALYPIVRSAYEGRAATGVERLVGTRGVARQRLDASGYVQIRGELWRAELADGAAPVDAGAAVEVSDAVGLVLTVRATVSSE